MMELQAVTLKAKPEKASMEGLRAEPWRDLVFACLAHLGWDKTDLLKLNSTDRESTES